MPDVRLNVVLSTNRNESGLLYVSDTRTGKVLAVYEALGRGSRGSGDTQFLEKGNTPTGSYAVDRIESTANWNQSSYGPNGALRLTPTGGNAALAARKGILVHGGSTVTASSKAASFRGVGGLKPTHGCIRLRNEDMKGLINILYAETLDVGAAQSRNITVDLQVTETPACIASPPSQK